MLDFVLYRSRARDEPDEAMLMDILRTSVRNNTRDRISGFLHVRQGTFCQYIEGHREPLYQRLRIIKADRRHHNFETLVTGKVHEPLFPNWDMGGLETKDLKLEGRAKKRPGDPDQVDLDVWTVIDVFEHHWQRMYDLKFGEEKHEAGLEVHARLMAFLRSRLLPFRAQQEIDRQHLIRQSRHEMDAVQDKAADDAA